MSTDDRMTRLDAAITEARAAVHDAVEAAVELPYSTDYCPLDEAFMAVHRVLDRYGDLRELRAAALALTAVADCTTAHVCSRHAEYACPVHRALAEKLAEVDAALEVRA